MPHTWLKEFSSWANQKELNYIAVYTFNIFFSAGQLHIKTIDLSLGHRRVAFIILDIHFLDAVQQKFHVPKEG